MKRTSGDTACLYQAPDTAAERGKVERSHGTDEKEIYPLLTYIADVDLDLELSIYCHYNMLH